MAAFAKQWTCVCYILRSIDFKIEIQCCVIVYIIHITHNMRIYRVYQGLSCRANMNQFTEITVYSYTRNSYMITLVLQFTVLAFLQYIMHFNSYSSCQLDFLRPDFSDAIFFKVHYVKIVFLCIESKRRSCVGKLKEKRKKYYVSCVFF